MKQVYEYSEREIQGLFSSKDSCESFWTLKAKVELSVFQDHRKEKTKQ